MTTILGFLSRNFKRSFSLASLTRSLAFPFSTLTTSTPSRVPSIPILSFILFIVDPAPRKYIPSLLRISSATASASASNSALSSIVVASLLPWTSISTIGVMASENFFALTLSLL
ncbi:114aa long hypothetical protein [Pyrococcus horikoshii OT3]|uniref:Uncharacterized protein n=1 Tax=Pyrococcus horikoshii (strain ATCC 700860 / DSM 12428 / JCM 9974 / NBRC 100139 / OT-3) TaxID=70601 RepID=O59326_PYRHO|nr:114aa long hypothetical protein [Pyrococcus horikoshii OT3]